MECLCTGKLVSARGGEKAIQDKYFNFLRTLKPKKQQRYRIFKILMQFQKKSNILETVRVKEILQEAKQETFCT